jgi:hypothetical protein
MNNQTAGGVFRPASTSMSSNCRVLVHRGAVHNVHLDPAQLSHKMTLRLVTDLVSNGVNSMVADKFVASYAFGEVFSYNAV